MARQHTSHILSVQLNKRLPSPASAFKSLHTTLILPDIESSSTKISRTLLPIVRQLKWCIRRDQLARRFKSGPRAGEIAFWAWVEDGGRSIVQDTETLRLAICPDVKKKVYFYETLDANTRSF